MNKIMGKYSYVCELCNHEINNLDCIVTTKNDIELPNKIDTNKYLINIGEMCRLIHVRNGEIIGNVVGQYNGYGSIWYDEYIHECYQFNGIHNINSQYEIQKSIDLNNKKSGIIAFHEKCYADASDIDIRDYNISRYAINSGMNKINENHLRLHRSIIKVDAFVLTNVK